MKLKKYTHKFIEIVTDKFVLKLSDKRDEAPVQINITITPFGKSGGQGVPQQATLTVEEARELNNALLKMLKHAPKKKNEKSNV